MSIMISEPCNTLTETGSGAQAAQAVASLETRMANIEARLTDIETEIRMLK